MIIAISVVACRWRFPLNYMVGREFVPNEDMGEWTIHLDAPEGTSLEGTTEVAFKLLKELSGIEGVAQIEPSIGVSGPGSQTHIHFLCQALPLERAQEHAGARSSRRCGGGCRRIPATGRRSPRATRSAAAKAPAGSRSRRTSSGPTSTQIAEYSKRALAEAQKLPSLDGRRRSTLNVSNPEVHVAVDRKRAADLGVRMATIGNTLRLAVAGDDEISFYKEGPEQYPGQDPRAREPAAATSRRSAG